MVGSIKWWCIAYLIFVVYIGPKSRKERPRKTKIGTREVDTTFQVKNLQGQGYIVAASRTARWSSIYTSKAYSYVYVYAT